MKTTTGKGGILEMYVAMHKQGLQIVSTDADIVGISLLKDIK